MAEIDKAFSNLTEQARSPIQAQYANPLQGKPARLKEGAGGGMSMVLPDFEDKDELDEEGLGTPEELDRSILDKSKVAKRMEKGSSSPDAAPGMCEGSDLNGADDLEIDKTMGRAYEASRAFRALGINESDDHWIEHAHLKKGALHKALGKSPDEKISTAVLHAATKKGGHVAKMAQAALNMREDAGFDALPGKEKEDILGDMRADGHFGEADRLGREANEGYSTIRKDIQKDLDRAMIKLDEFQRALLNHGNSPDKDYNRQVGAVIKIADSLEEELDDLMVAVNDKNKFLRLDQ